MSLLSPDREKRSGPESDPAGQLEAGNALDSPDEVVGERGIPSVSQERSLQTRIHHALAIGLVLLVGGGFLTWYYAHLASRHRDEQAAKDPRAEAKASAEMNLPPLGRIDPPEDARAPQSAAAERQEDLDALANTPAIESTSLLDRPPEPDLPTDAVDSPLPVATANAPSPEKLTLERQLTSPVLWRASMSMASLPADSSMVMPAMDGVSGASPVSASPPSSGLGGELQATITTAVRAERLPTQKLLLPKGAFLDCTLETAIDSTLPGLATCVLATDVFSSDGSVVLLERGTKLVGEVKSDVRAGQARVFVLWNEARTPQGIVVALASPATDALGRSGIAGTVDSHFDERFGAAILVSVIEGSIQALVASQQPSSGTAVVVSPEGSAQIATEILKSTVAIPPTIRVAQGTRVQVLVARDVDFRSVYALISR